MHTQTGTLLHLGAETEFVEQAVADSDLSLSVESVETVTEARSLLSGRPVSGVVAETERGDGSGLSLLDSDDGGVESVPVVALTRSVEGQKRAIDSGVRDVYLHRGDAAEPAVLGRRLESALESRQLLSAYAKMLSETVLLLDDNGEVITATVGSEEVVATETAGEIAGQTLSSLVTEGDAERTAEHVERVVSGETSQETLSVSFPREDGTAVPGEIRLSAVRGVGARRVILATVADVLPRSDDEHGSTPLADLLIDTLDDVFYILDPAGRLVRWNDHLRTVTGYSDAEIAEMEPLDFFADAERDKTADTIAQILDTGSGGVEASMETSDGEQIPFEYTGTVLTDREGTTRGAVGIGRDISERKERERMLRQYETIIEVLADPVYVIDDDGRYSYVNDAFVEHTGYDRDEIVGSHVSKVLPDEEIERGRDVIRTLLSDDDKQSTTWEMTRVTADGETVPTENHTALLPRGDDGQFRGSVGAIRDISERKRRERTLQRERDRFKSVFDAAPNPFVHVSFEGDEPTVLAVNDAFERDFGVDADEIIGSSLESELVPESERSTARELYEAIQSGESVTSEVTRLSADGSEREFLFNASALAREDDTVEGVVAYVDITDRKRRTDLLEELRQNITDVVWMTDTDKETMEFVSEAYEEVWGRSADSLYAEPQSFAEAIHPDDSDRVETALERQGTEPEAYEETYRVQQPDGETRWVRDRATGVYEDGELQRVLGIATDITERRDRERELRLKNRAMDEAPIGITIHDATTDGCPITYANSGFEQLTGYGPESIEGERLSTLTGAETADSQVTELRTAFDDGDAASLVALLYRDDGAPFWGRISLAPVADEGGATTHFVGFLQDVTEIKEHEQEVARRLEEFGELLAEDLRVPVQQAQAEITDAAGDGDSDRLDAAEHSLERVENLIDDLVTVHSRSVTSREVGDRLDSSIGDSDGGVHR